jgi:hypothetical protein
MMDLKAPRREQTEKERSMFQSAPRTTSRTSFGDKLDDPGSGATLRTGLTSDERCRGLDSGDPFGRGHTSRVSGRLPRCVTKSWNWKVDYRCMIEERWVLIIRN